MSEDSKVKLLDHEYDGIHELDNPLPMWWLITFYLTIAFSIGYVFYYHLGDGDLIQDEFRKDLAALQFSPKSTSAQQAPRDSNALLAISKDSARREAGKRIFAEKCASCHAPRGEGLIGPNLTDKFWIHGDGGITSVAETIDKGVADKGMPPWGAMLKTEELENVIGFVFAMRSEPIPGKAPQGKEYP